MSDIPFDELKQRIVDSLDPDELISALDLEIEELVDALGKEFLTNHKHKLYFLE